MHFVGMLAERSPFPVDYLVLPTLISFLVCVIVVGAAVLAASAGPPTVPRIGAAAVFMGLGIVAMHYIGMQTLSACAEMTNSPWLVVDSAAIAIAASGFALWLAFGGVSHSLPLSAVALGLAISGMHYTAMSGLSLYPRIGFAQDPALSPDLLAVVVAIVAFLVSGGFLLLLLPERTRGVGEPLAEAEAPAQEAAPSEARRRLGAFPPLGGAGSPPRRAASHIGVQRNGLIHQLPVEAIVAVHADAHWPRCSTARRRIFARCRSARSSTGWIPAGWRASTAAILSTSPASSAPVSTATAARSSLRAAAGFRCP